MRRSLFTSVVLAFTVLPGGTGYEPACGCEQPSSTQSPIGPETSTNEILSAIEENRLAGDDLRMLVNRLVDRFVQRKSNRYLYRIRKIHHVEPDAVAEQLPRLARLLGTLRYQETVCDLLTMLVHFDELPIEIEEAVAARFHRLQRGERESLREELFVKPLAAAVLLKFWPEKYDTRAWLENRLDDEEKLSRLTAASALDLTGAAAGESVPALMGLLNDEFASVRVMTVSALWDLEHEAVRPEELVSTLLESLQEPDDVIILKPHGLSGWLPGHRLYAVGTLGQAGVRKADVALALIEVLGDEDEVLRLYALKSLAQLGHRGEAVTEAVNQLLSDPNPTVAHQAAITLEELTE